jgi:Spy/CpxP family protein refolding chaperone
MKLPVVALKSRPLALLGMTSLPIGLLLCASTVALGQDPVWRGDPVCVVDGAVRPPADCGLARQQPPPDADPLARYFFSPELVMAHQQEINLTDAQRAAIQKAMKEAQGKFIDTQFEMGAEMSKLQNLLQGKTADEARVLEQIDRVLGLEREIKRAQLTLMIRIKNQLTEDQQATLNRFRPQGPPPGGRPSGVTRPPRPDGTPPA